MTTVDAYSKTCTYLGPDYDARTSRVSPAPYCGCATNGHSSYCSTHYPVVYNVGTAQRKRHKDIRVKTSLEDIVQMIIEIDEELETEGWTPEQGWEEEVTV